MKNFNLILLILLMIISAALANDIADWIDHLLFVYVPELRPHL